MTTVSWGFCSGGWVKVVRGLSSPGTSYHSDTEDTEDTEGTEDTEETEDRGEV